MFLYCKDFPELGHVHTGNIFIEVDEDGKGKCQLGGYVNTLLGYRSEVHAKMTYDKNIDVIMFGRGDDPSKSFIHNIALSHAGHVIYEMGAGKPLDPSKLYPDDDDLEAVKDGSVRDVLKYICDGKGVSIMSVRKLAED